MQMLEERRERKIAHAGILLKGLLDQGTDKSEKEALDLVNKKRYAIAVVRDPELASRIVNSDKQVFRWYRRIENEQESGLISTSRRGDVALIFHAIKTPRAALEVLKRPDIIEMEDWYTNEKVGWHLKQRLSRGKDLWGVHTKVAWVVAVSSLVAVGIPFDAFRYSLSVLENGLLIATGVLAFTYRQIIDRTQLRNYRKGIKQTNEILASKSTAIITAVENQTT